MPHESAAHPARCCLELSRMLYRFHWLIAAVLIVLFAMALGLVLPGGEETAIVHQAWQISPSPSPWQ